MWHIWNVLHTWGSLMFHPTARPSLQRSRRQPRPQLSGLRLLGVTRGASAHGRPRPCLSRVPGRLEGRGGKGREGRPCSPVVEARPEEGPLRGPWPAAPSPGRAYLGQLSGAPGQGGDGGSDGGGVPSGGPGPGAASPGEPRRRLCGGAWPLPAGERAGTAAAPA